MLDHPGFRRAGWAVMAVALLVIAVGVIVVSNRVGSGNQAVRTGAVTTLSLPSLEVPSSDDTDTTVDPAATTDPILLPTTPAGTGTTLPAGTGTGTTLPGVPVTGLPEATTRVPASTTTPAPTTTTTSPPTPSCIAAREAQYAAQVLGSAGQQGRYTELRTDASILSAALQRLIDLTAGATRADAMQLLAAVNKALQANVNTSDAGLQQVFNELQASNKDLATRLFGTLLQVCPNMNNLTGN